MRLYCLHMYMHAGIPQIALCHEGVNSANNSDLCSALYSLNSKEPAILVSHSK